MEGSEVEEGTAVHIVVSTGRRQVPVSDKNEKQRKEQQKEAKKELKEEQQKERKKLREEQQKERAKQRKREE